MFGNSGSASGHIPTLLPATSVSPASTSISPLYHLPSSFVSQSADPSPSSAVLFPSSVIVPPQLHYQMGTSSSATSSIETTTPLFGANPLMNNLIASLATLSRPHPPIITQSQSHQNGVPFITEVFQNSLAECLRHSSSTPNAKNESVFCGAMDNNNNNRNTSMAMPNANFFNNAPLPSADHLQFVQYSSVAQKSLSSVELLQRALEAFAVANQSKLVNSSAPPAPSVIGNPLIHPPIPHSQSQQFTNGATASTTINNIEQQLLSLLNFSQLSSNNNNTSSENGHNLDTFPPFSHQNLSSNGICHHSSSVTTTTAPTNISERIQHNEAKASASSDPSMPIDLSSSNQQHSLLLSSAANLALSSVPRGRKSCDIRRSASSVSYKGNADVHEHFQRTFSGKWPRRQPSLRSHLQMGGGRAAVGKKEAAICIGENGAECSGAARTEEPMEEEEEEEGESGERNGTEMGETGHKTPEEKAKLAQKGRPKSGQHVKSMYTAVIRKLFTSNEVKQVEDHFRKSLGEDRFRQIKNEQQRKQREEQPIGNEGERTTTNIVRL